MITDANSIEIDKTVHNIRIKTAVDRDTRAAKESQLFDIQSIPSGTRFWMSIEADDSKDLEYVCQLLESRNGEILIGKSRSAEYGRARIHRNSPHTQFSSKNSSSTGSIYLYLLSDLILWRNGMPVLIPQASDFGLPDDLQLDEEHTFVRTRRYSPWNAFFNRRMSERQTLSKGSVLTFSVPSGQSVDLQELQQVLKKGIGLHREEGFGQILVNPSWLEFTNLTLCSKDHKTKRDAGGHEISTKVNDHPLLNYLRNKSEESNLTYSALDQGRKWAEEWFRISKKVQKNHRSVPGKSQWGQLRAIARKNLSAPNKLKEDIKTFCGEARRKIRWESGSEGSLKDAVLNKIESPDKTTALALHYACIEMTRKLQSQQNQD